MRLFIDTNILLRIVQPTHPLNSQASNKLSTFIREGETLALTPQIMAEFWNVATRPLAHNGLGMAPSQAFKEMEALQNYFTVLSESEEVYLEWKRLVSHYGVTGVKTHDARIVAAMKIYGITRILTFNSDDFARYKEIQIITP